MHVNNPFKFLVLLLKWTQPNATQPMGQPNPWTTLARVAFSPGVKLCIYLSVSTQAKRLRSAELRRVMAVCQVRAEVVDHVTRGPRDRSAAVRRHRKRKWRHGGEVVDAGGQAVADIGGVD